MWGTLGLLGAALQDKGVCSLAAFQALAQAVWARLQPLVAQETDVMQPFLDTEQPTTLYLSLHRLLALVLQSACVVHGHALAQVAPFLTAPVALVLAAQVARALRFVSTHEAGLWRRNGETAATQVFFYLSPMCVRYTVDRDLFLMRCCLSVMPDGAQLLQMLCCQMDTSTVAASVGREALLRWLLAMACDTHCFEPDREHSAALETAHCLAACGGSAPRSRLTELLPDELVDSKAFDRVLQQVAQFKGNTFTLKPALWAQLDPYHSHFSADQRQAAEEAWIAESKRASTADKGAAALSMPPLPLPADGFAQQQSVLPFFGLRSVGACER